MYNHPLGMTLYNLDKAQKNIALMKKVIEDNNFDFNARMEEIYK